MSVFLEWTTFIGFQLLCLRIFNEKNAEKKKPAPRVTARVVDTTKKIGR